MSTDAEILSFLKSESSRLSNYLPASKIITSRIKKWERHLDNVLNSLLLDEDDNRLRSDFWKETTHLVLTRLYLPHNKLYVALEKLYTNKTRCVISRPIVGESTDFKEEPQDECHVCCESIDTHLSCGHWIHIDCVVQTGKAECPLCKKVVSMSIDDVVKMEKISKKKKIDEERQVIRAIMDEELNEEFENRMSEFLTNVVNGNIYLARSLTNRGVFPMEQYNYLSDLIYSARRHQIPQSSRVDIRNTLSFIENVFMNEV